MKRIRRIMAILAVIVVLLAGAVAGVIVYDTRSPAQSAADFTNVSYPAPDGTELSAYLARPANNDIGPGILLVHEFYGLNEDMVHKADLLAAEGYTVLAVDAYRGQSTRLVPRAIWLATTTPEERILQDLNAGLAYLARQETVEPTRIAAVGFCFGGTQVLRLGARNPGLAANVIFYGSGLTTDPAELGDLGQGGPVLGIFGEQDMSIPVSEVEAFQDALEARSVEHTISVYPDVGHAFVNTETIQQPGPAREAWLQMVEFLRDALQASM